MVNVGLIESRVVVEQRQIGASHNGQAFAGPGLPHFVLSTLARSLKTIQNTLTDYND